MCLFKQKMELDNPDYNQFCITNSGSMMNTGFKWS